MALETADQILQMADQLTASADAIHRRLLTAIKNKEISAADADQTLQDETILRKRADAMFIDAAVHVVNGLALAQQELVDTINKGNEKLKDIKKVNAFLDFVADMLALAAAIYSAKPKTILAAFKEVKADIDAFGKLA